MFTITIVIKEETTFYFSIRSLLAVDIFEIILKHYFPDTESSMTLSTESCCSEFTFRVDIDNDKLDTTSTSAGESDKDMSTNSESNSDMSTSSVSNTLCCSSFGDIECDVDKTEVEIVNQKRDK